MRVTIVRLVSRSLPALTLGVGLLGASASPSLAEGSAATTSGGSSAGASASSSASTDGRGCRVVRSQDNAAGTAAGDLSSSVQTGPGGLSGSTTIGPNGPAVTVHPGGGAASTATAGSSASGGSASANSDCVVVEPLPPPAGAPAR